MQIQKKICMLGMKGQCAEVTEHDDGAAGFWVIVWLTNAWVQAQPYMIKNQKITYLKSDKLSLDVY